MNNTDKIPLGCIGNIKVIGAIKDSPEFKATLRKMAHNHETASEWPFFNLSWGIYILYCLIVVPKEHYEVGEDSEFFEDFKKMDIFRNFNFIKSPVSHQDYPHKHFEFMRNSISHVNYSIEGSDIFRMWDHPVGKPQNKHWEIEVTHQNMQVFIAELVKVVSKELERNEA